MKRYLMFAFAVVIGLSLVTVSFAQTPAAPKAAPAVSEKAPAAPATPAPAPEKKAAKEKVLKFKGQVAAFDAAAKTLTVKGKDGEKAFDVTAVKMAKEPKAGDKVVVKYTEKDGKMTAKSVKLAKDKKKSVPDLAAPPAGPAPAPAK
jgi:phage baseplate assembly protein gpV